MKHTDREHDEPPSRGHRGPVDAPYVTGPAPIPINEPWEYALRCPRDPRGPAVARAMVTSVLRAHGLGELTDRAELLAAELTTNAVRHTQGPASMRLCWAHPVLRVSVLDDSPALPLRPVSAEPDDEGGRGLFILDLLADAWGACRVAKPAFGARGKYVWFELVLRAAPPGAPGKASLAA
ncbi:ATP-binding protein [Streptomyces montanisoli]|uniref:ATP-binding protein n=1 Tax=Streptomyces montanisoli TaxID=2798581 RepID=UPI0027DB0582|nr:ATP-binding protein [Streptomyces montanisoli]